MTEPGEIVEDPYGKGDVQSWIAVSEENVIRVYRSADSNEGELERTVGGRYPVDHPLMIFTGDSQIKTGMRVSYLDKTYEIDAITRYRTHLEANSTLVTDEGG
ncbi:hypothetical protein [Halocatena halophila]|uniref:hypothetical protein n=1 Tax=Halocatena halophila TaxID=2814576 RepID=UPI002ED348D4